MKQKLKFAHLFPEVWKSLGEIPRAGWVNRGVENPETDLEHVVDCMEFIDDKGIRAELFDLFNNDHRLRILFVSFENYIQDQKDQLEVHEYPEWKDGDITPLITDDPEEKRKFRELKFEREYNTMVELRDSHGEAGVEVFNLWLRFEAKENGECSFPRQVDWYRSIVKAWKYEQEGKNVRAQDFIDSYRKDITHPILTKRISVIENQLKNTRI